MAQKVQKETFEKNIAIVDEEIRKRKNKWNLGLISRTLSRY